MAKHLLSGHNVVNLTGLSVVTSLSLLTEHIGLRLVDQFLAYVSLGWEHWQWLRILLPCRRVHR